MASAGNYLYVADWGNQITSYSFFMWPTPKQENVVSVPDKFWYLLINGTALYCMSSSTLYAYSLVDPTTPALQDSFSLPSIPGGLAVQGNYLYVVTQHTLEILDISNPLSLVSVKSMPLSTTGTPVCLTVSGQFAWYGTASDASHLVRIWPPTAPVDLGKFYTTPWQSSTWDIQIIGNYYVDTRSPFGMGIYKIY